MRQTARKFFPIEAKRSRGTVNGGFSTALPRPLAGSLGNKKDGYMDIDITPIDYRNVDIPYYIDFVTEEFKKHISLVKNKDYKKIAFIPSNRNSFKSFFEEIVPLMCFLQGQKTNYQKIKYMSGDQPGDAILDDTTTIEITKAHHERKYLEIQDRLNHGYSFTPKNIQKTVTASSPTKTQPYVYTNKEHVDDVALYIHNAIEKKQTK
jgi:hypothetical protein